MGKEVVFRTALVSLATVMALTGLYTQSLKKMAGTYLFGMVVISGVLLPDWEFFDRPVSQWCTLVTDRHSPSAPARLKVYPMRVVIYTAVYGFCFYNWWKFIRG